MKKSFLFILSVSVAVGIAVYTKKEQARSMALQQPQWKTYIKKQGAEIDAHKTTVEEFKEAKITAPAEAVKPATSPSRSIASVNPYQGFMVRDGRILMGELDKKYEDENNSLEMINKINPKWRDIMGNSLMRFQPEDTKLMVKEEVPVIKIQEGQGRYLEQVTVSYLQKDGFRSSFKALVDSESGIIVETWDRTIHEHFKKTRGDLTLPSTNESGIITK
jgi:hypothetical protein